MRPVHGIAHLRRLTTTISPRWLILAALLVVGASNARAQDAQPTPTIRDEVRLQYTPEQYRNFLKREASRASAQQAEKVFSSAPTDALGNNNGGATATGLFTQSETTILAFGNKIVLGFNDSGSNSGGTNKFTGFAYSADGGATFTDGGTLPTNAGGDAGDPVLARNESTGRIYFATLGFSISTIQVFRSDDDGVTWTAPVNGTPGGSSEDKQWMAVDNFPGAGNGNVYLISRRFGTPAGIYMFRSTDHGATFGPTGGTLLVSGQQGAFVTVGPDHSVYAFWWNGSTIQMRKSTNFGVTFGAAVTVATGLTGGTNGDLALTGIRQGTATASAFRSNSFPHAAVNPVSGNLYVTFNDNPAGTDKGDVYLVTSADGGATWSARIRVNDDATTTDQWQPTLAVTPDGTGVGVFYYSRQEDPAGNNLFKFYGRTGFITGSTVTFLPSFAISDVASLPEFGRDNLINATYMGDYDFAVATPGKFHVVWADNRDDLPGGAPRKDPNVYYESIPAGLLTGPNVFVSPTNADFGSVAVTQTGVRQIHITNAGDAPLTVSSITSPAPDFSLTVPSLPAVIPSTGTITLTATFSPASLGPQNSSFIITSDAVNQPVVTVSLAGTGVQNISVSPLNVDFGIVAVGQNAGPIPVTIQNPGTVNLTVSSITTPAGDFSLTHPALPLVIPALGTATVNTFFSPTVPGPHSSSFDIGSDAIGAPTVTVSLQGTGIVAPPNDLCVNAIPIDCGTSVDGTTMLATFDNVGTCGTSNTAPGVWYSLVGTGAPITVSTCLGASYDSKISVFAGSCGTLTCVGGNDDACALRSRVTFNSVLGAPYLILVHGFLSATGTFTLDVSTCPAEIAVTPTELCFTVPLNGTQSGALDIANVADPGALDLNWIARSSLPGLSVGPIPEIGAAPVALFQITPEMLEAIRRLVPNAVRLGLEALLPYPPSEKEPFVDLVVDAIGEANATTFNAVIMENAIQFHDEVKETESASATLAGAFAANRVGAPVVNGFGGPDPFGYEWIDSDSPGGPTFSWIDITGSGTPVTLTDDSSILVPLSFTFPFYGVGKTQVRIGSNGYLTFGTSGSTFSNASIPTLAVPNDIICPFWDDLNPATSPGGTIHYLAGATQFIVQYTNIRRFNTTTPTTFEVILNSDGSILYQYLDMQQALLTSATVGIENAAGAVGTQVAFNAAYIHNNLAVRLAVPPPCGWITSITPSSGTVPGGGVQPAALGIDATGLALGTYQCEVKIVSNAANAPVVVVPVTLNVVENVAPLWTTAPASGDQSVQYSDAIADVELEASDDGLPGGPLSVSSSFTKDAGPSTSGLPTGLSLSAPTCEPGTCGSQTCAWTLSGQMLEPAGVYVISLVAGDGDLSSDPFIVTLTVGAENTDIAFDSGNPSTVQVEAPGGASPSFTLKVDVSEFDNPDNVADDANLAGDINQTVVSVELVPVGPGSNVNPVGPCASVVTAGLADPDSPYDYDVRSLTCTFDDVPVNTYAVVVTVNGGYYSGLGEEVLTIFDPSLGFTTGGGWFYWPGSANPNTGYAGDKTNFGFNVQPANPKKKTPLKGSLLVVRHLADGSYARLKSTQMTGLAVGSGSSYAYATFSGNGTYKAIAAPEPEGNHTFTAYVEDRGSPGTSDKFWLQVKKGSTVKADLSMATPAANNARTLAGGNIVLPHLSGGSLEAKEVAQETAELPTTFALGPNVPNPFRGETLVQFQLPADAPVSLIVYDVAGREVARLVDGFMNAGRHSVTWRAFNAPGGVYFARFSAGSFIQTRRLLLLK